MERDVLDKQAVAAISTTKLLEQLECSELGLNAEQVTQRRAQYGVNALSKERTTAVRVLVRQFQSVLIYFLMVAAVLAFATNDLSDGVIITIILLINATLGFFQEYRSERAVEKLALLISDRVLVKRDGSSAFVEVYELVPGDLGVIVNAIRYGRITFANINKYIKCTMVGNFGNFFALAVLYLLTTELPLLPKQILLISLLTDLPLVAISSDTVDGADLEQPDRYDPRALLSISLVLGSLTALVELAFFLTLYGKAGSVSEASLYLFLSFTQLIVILSIRNRDHFWKAVRPSRPLLGAMALTALVTVAIPYTPPLAQIFSFGTPSLAELGLVLAAALAYVLVLDTLKVWYYRLSSRGSPLHGAFHKSAKSRVTA